MAAKKSPRVPTQKTPATRVHSTVEHLRRVRLEKEKLRVKHLQMDLVDKEKDFLERYTLKANVIRMAVAVKNRLLALPSRVAPVVTAMSSPAEIQAYLFTEMVRELNDLTHGLEDDEKRRQQRKGEPLSKIEERCLP